MIHDTNGYFNHLGFPFYLPRDRKKKFGSKQNLVNKINTALLNLLRRNRLENLNKQNPETCITAILEKKITFEKRIKLYICMFAYLSRILTNQSLKRLLAYVSVNATS